MLSLMSLMSLMYNPLAKTPLTAHVPPPTPNPATPPTRLPPHPPTAPRSLLYVLFVILAMYLPFNSRRIVWRYAVVPVLLLLAIFHLAEYLHLPELILKIDEALNPSLAPAPGPSAYYQPGAML